MAAVTRIANDEHQDVQLERGDSIIFSSKIIPGNEKKIFALFNALCKKGVEVLTERDHFVHVSGHPSRKEVQELYSLLRPKIAIPVHGEPMHLHEHCRVALASGVQHALEVEDGALINLSAEKPCRIATVTSGFLAVDGSAIIDGESPILRERSAMRDNGIILVTLMKDRRSGKLLTEPFVLPVGILDVKKETALIEEIKDDIVHIVSTSSSQGTKTTDRSTTNETIISRIKSHVRTCIRHERDKAPLVVVHVEEIL
ncbi:MAG: ribonuclease J [Proteobacteria bacterium]|nr:ribonuclease J [Pseudomonadota bacterium]